MFDRILVIDDNEALLDSHRRWIRRELGCVVDCATDREEAEALLDCYQYSLVLTDLSLTPQRPEGLDLVARVANVPERPNLIVLTGNGTGRVRTESLRKGAHAFLEKPTPMKDIIALARKLTEDKCAGPQQAAETPLEGKLLTRLLDSSGLTPYVQPIFRVAGDMLAVVGVECLTRGPAGTPFERVDALFAYARHKRAESLVDRQCIELALAAVAGIPEEIRISVNVHASTLGRDASFADWLPDCAARNSVPCGRLTVEIVEHSTAWNHLELGRTLHQLRAAGIQIALDDVGLGESNYHMMVNARPDYLKIDRFFIHDCAGDKYRHAIVASIVKLADQLRAAVVAEGVENLDDFRILQDSGISLVQGFAFCRPMPAAEFSLPSLQLRLWDRFPKPPGHINPSISAELIHA
jgi:EAL domain-containing protein (putative c-di-GMP-specific phosphodiesterase class I)